MGKIKQITEQGFKLIDIGATCPFCGSKCALGKVFGYHIICDNLECGADIQYFGAENDPVRTASRFNRRKEDIDGNPEEDHGDL